MNKKPEKPFEGFKWVSRFASKDDSRPVLNSVYIDSTNKGGFTCERVAVAADGYRMAILRVPDDTPLDYLNIKTGESLDNKLKHSTYPAWDMLVPKDVPYELSIDTSDLIDALKAGKNMGDIVYLMFEADAEHPKGESTLSLYFPNEHGAAIMQIKAQLTKGYVAITDHDRKTNNKHPNYKINIAINTRYLLNALDLWKPGYVSIGLNDRDTMITISQKIDNDALALIMLCKPGRNCSLPSFTTVWAKIRKFFEK